jgi:hypothetical protein
MTTDMPVDATDGDGVSGAVIGLTVVVAPEVGYLAWLPR